MKVWLVNYDFAGPVAVATSKEDADRLIEEYVVSCRAGHKRYWEAYGHGGTVRPGSAAAATLEEHMESEEKVVRNCLYAQEWECDRLFGNNPKEDA